MGTENSVLLEMKHAGKFFGGLKAVDDINLSIREGELHALIGPNGAGKSTLFKMLMGVYPPTSGNILFDGHDITRLKSWDRVRQGISIKMQIPGVFGHLTVYDNMKIAAQAYFKHQEMEEEIDRLLNELDIHDLRSKMVNSLSHGQQQWLEIGMALACRPKLLLLDEPAAGMGPEETAYTAELIHRLNEKGLTILFIDHDMDFVKRIAKRATVLHLGRKFAEGSVSEIESNAKVAAIYLGK